MSPSFALDPPGSSTSFLRNRSFSSWQESQDRVRSVRFLMLWGTVPQ